MSTEELIAQVDASYEIEKARGEAITKFEALLGPGRCRDFYRWAWIVGHQAGLQAAKDVISS